MNIENTQHWIARVHDSVNGYDEAQAAYFDGAQAEAEQYFRDLDRCPVIARYIGSLRYRIVMAANAIVLQDSGP